MAFDNPRGSQETASGVIKITHQAAAETGARREVGAGVLRFAAKAFPQSSGGERKNLSIDTHGIR